jgi:hypothetical protein
MTDRGSKLSVKRQAELLDLSRSSVYYPPRPVSPQDLKWMRRIDELHLEAPFFGARKIAAQLRREGHAIARRHSRSSIASALLLPAALTTCGKSMMTGPSGATSTLNSERSPWMSPMLSMRTICRMRKS